MMRSGVCLSWKTTRVYSSK